VSDTAPLVRSERKQLRALRDAERAYLAKRLHLPMGRPNMPIFGNFQKLISR